MKVNEIIEAIHENCSAPIRSLYYREGLSALEVFKTIYVVQNRPFDTAGDVLAITCANPAISEHCTFKFVKPWRHIENPDDFVWQEIDENFIQTLNGVLFENFVADVYQFLKTMSVRVDFVESLKMESDRKTQTITICVSDSTTSKTFEVKYGRRLIVDDVEVSYSDVFTSILYVIKNFSENSSVNNLNRVLTKYVGRTIDEPLIEEIVTTILESGVCYAEKKSVS